MLIAKKYEIIEKIGKGGFGTVYKAVYLKNAEPVAIKMESTRTTMKLLKHETTILKYLQERGCDNVPVVHWYGIHQENTCLIMTYYDCSLYEYFENIQNREPERKDKLIQGCIRLLEQVHRNYVLHRDIKPQNIMIRQGELFLIDFGFSIFYINADTREHIEGQKDTIVGSPRYASYYVHEGCVSSRRDDLISVGYIYIWILLKDLPWNCLVKIGEQEQEQENILIMSELNLRRKEMKSWPKLGEYCMQINQKIWNFLNYCYLLRYDAEPNYRLLYEIWM